MKISPELEWLRGYIELVAPMIHGIDKLKSIKSRRPKKDFSENQTFHGQITKYYDGKNHLITLYTHYLHFNIKGDLVEIEIKKYSTLDILKFLAHELSHLLHWYHNPYHWALEADIAKMFCVKLLEDGYTCEEDMK